MVAVACFLRGLAKDLSAHPRNLYFYTIEEFLCVQLNNQLYLNLVQFYVFLHIIFYYIHALYVHIFTVIIAYNCDALKFTLLARSCIILTLAISNDCVSSWIQRNKLLNEYDVPQ